jgi:predicted GH43/DUF377 family glycosyl hydrolase
MIVWFVLLSFFLTSSRAQTKWFKYEANPVLKVGPPGSWDASIVHTGRVIFQDSIYKMWYTGFSGTKSWLLGYATSRDGIIWKKYRRNPILWPDSQSWDNFSTFHAYVAPRGSKYDMWYTGGDSARFLRIGYAISEDGIHWEKATGANPVLDLGPAESWHGRIVVRPSVLLDNTGIFKMWFGAEGLIRNNVRIGLATAANTTDWKKLRSLRAGSDNVNF